MSISSSLLKARHIGIRDLKGRLSTKFLNGIMIITDRGLPISVNLPYSDILELVDIVDELSDSNTIKTVLEGRTAVKKGTKGVSVSDLFKKLRAKK